METQLRDKWVAALRSGNYAQGTGSLRDRDNKFCCLGVLCDLVEPTAWVQVEPEEGFTHRGWGGYPHDALLRELGLDDAEDIPGDTHTLATMNDDGATFAEIADWIEENLVVTAVACATPAQIAAAMLARQIMEAV